MGMEQRKRRKRQESNRDSAEFIIDEDKGTLIVQLSKSLEKRMARLVEKTAGTIPAI